MSQSTEDHKQPLISLREGATESSLLPMLIGGLVLIVLAMVIVAIIA